MVQFREEPLVQQEELASFRRHGGLAENELDFHNVFDQGKLDQHIGKKYNAVFFGGASTASVLEPNRFPFVKDAIRLQQQCITDGTPVFASCFGFQLAVLALGGKILHQEDNFELGVMPITLAPLAATDPIFGGLPPHIVAVSVHQQKAVTLPEICERLTYTWQSEHAFRVRGRPFWAFQFHPEIDRETFVERLYVYQRKYTKGDPQVLQRTIRNAEEADTSIANSLVRRFVSHVKFASNPE